MERQPRRIDQVVQVVKREVAETFDPKKGVSVNIPLKPSTLSGGIAGYTLGANIDGFRGAFIGLITGVVAGEALERRLARNEANRRNLDHIDNDLSVENNR